MITLINSLGYCHTNNYNLADVRNLKGSDDIGLESMINDADFFVDVRNHLLFSFHSSDNFLEGLV